MICVSIGRGRHRHMIAEQRHLVEQGAQLIELRLDYINGPVNIRRLITDRPSPVIISCRREGDGGKFTGHEQQRQILLRTAIAEGVEYVDLEEDVAGSIPRFGSTKRIISFHDFHKTPDDLEAIHARLCKFDPDVVKICTMANHPQDNLRILQLVGGSKVPMVGLCMGDIGIPSRLLTGRFGAPFTYATFHHERALAPGQLSFDQMKNIYHYDDITAETEVFGVVADPVGHSLSPLIHNTAFHHLGLNQVYLPFRVPREDLASFIADAPQLGVRGLSITIPHKELVVGQLAKADEAVRGIGACNTVVYEESRPSGFNSDYTAAMESLEAAIREANGDAQASLKGVKALILGAGGVGKAVAFGLVRRKADVTVTDIAPRHAQELARRFNCRTVEWSLRHSVPTELLINCTPVGMHPNVDETPFEKAHLRTSMIVFDAVYNPENTLLIKDARSRDCRVITGVDMFVRQAAIQFQHFTGREGPADLMRQVVRRAIGAARL